MSKSEQLFDKPSLEGVYWVKYKNYDGFYIIEIELSDDGELCVMFINNENIFLLDEYLNMHHGIQFWGPINPPITAYDVV